MPEPGIGKKDSKPAAQKFIYPGDLKEKHPVITRISILERYNVLGAVVQSGANPDTAMSYKKLIQNEDGTLTELGEKIANREIAGSIEDSIAQIYLYAPSSIQYSDGLQYDNQDLGLFAGALFGAAESAAQTNQQGGGYGEGLKNTGAGILAATAGEMATRSGVGQQVRLRSGVARNPRTEMLFKTPALRQLSLTWKLMPTNRQESNTIYELIKTIRANAYPSIGSTGQSSAFTFPNVFQVDFVTRRGNDSQMIKFAKAYCTSVNTSYGASGSAFFSDSGGEPVEVDLTVTFQETEIQTRESILNGGF